MLTQLVPLGPVRLSPGRQRPEDVPGAIIYVCPMHGSVRQPGPGNCPICGMALERETSSLNQGKDQALRLMEQRFGIGLIFVVPIFALDMAGHMLKLSISGEISNWIQFFFATPVVIWCGKPFFVRGWQSLKTRHLNMFTLVSIGIGVSWLYSAVATILPKLFPVGIRTDSVSAPVYFEAAAVITVLVLLGQILELRARQEAGGAIRALLNLKPKTALRVGADDKYEDVPIADIHVGDHLRVHPGATFPVDGVVTEGGGAVDEAMITGESMPAVKSIGSKVIGGTMNQTSSFVMEARHIGADSMIARIVSVVAEAKRSRAPIQGMADRVASWFVPAVLLIAISALSPGSSLDRLRSLVMR